MLPNVVHPDRLDDERLASMVFGMADTVGPEAFVYAALTRLTVRRLARA